MGSKRKSRSTKRGIESSNTRTRRALDEARINKENESASLSAGSENEQEISGEQILLEQAELQTTHSESAEGMRLIDCRREVVPIEELTGDLRTLAEQTRGGIPTEGELRERLMRPEIRGGQVADAILAGTREWKNYFFRKER